jgi:hypothetical protein
MSADTTLEALVAAITADAAGTVEMLNWAEEEIEQAMGRHPDHVDALHHAFTLIRPRDIGPGMGTEWVYRSHAAEILDRLASGADTRPATAAELCLLGTEASKVAPLHGAAAGLHFRMWQAAFPQISITANDAENLAAYEKLHGPQIDEFEEFLRRKAADPDRRLVDVECSGMHHNRRVQCRYETPLPLIGTDPRASGRRGRADATARATTRHRRRK